MNGFSKAVFPVTFVSVTVFLLLFCGIPGFRDGAHFYAPLFQYLYDEIAAGRLPLWNPYENLGQPLAANPTTAIFYPVTLFTLGISVLFQFDSLTAYTGYVAGHFLLALFLCYRLARCWGCSREASTFAALCYAFSGNVLFQWNNVPFLVGAAWLPEAVRQADRMIHRNKIRYAVGFGVVLALMILGGDPQAAYNAILCAVIQWAIECRKWKLRQWRNLYYFSFLFPMFHFRLLLLFLLSGVIVFFIAAVQILPAWELGTFSDRTLAIHQQTIYSFSVPPWRLAEFLLPGVGGWQFPENARWFSALPFDNEIWVPSFYMGFLPVLLTIFSFCECRNNVDANIGHVLRNCRILVAFIIFLLFAFGSLGNWFIIYPILTYLPSYDMFRYPAKLLVVATLMLAISAGAGFDRLRYEESFRWRIKIALWIYYIPAIFVLIIVLFRVNIFPAVPNCPLFGTFNTATARSGLLFTSISVLFFTFLIRWVIYWKSAPYFLLLFVALDLLTANTWMFATVPNRERNIATFFDNNTAKKTIPVRIYRFPVWYPAEFETTSSKQRL
ncbi:MAG: YfhO family protein, partial [Planctomycetaceae bacterium]|nr:YfhO family protein [Planctomycetaceae bacterium]